MARRLLVAGMIAGLALAGCKKTPEPPSTETMADMTGAIGAGGQEAQSIVDSVLAMPNHKTFSAALAASGVAAKLAEDGPFTVFAPTDSAFAQVPVATRNAWMRPESKAVLAGVLDYHIVAGTLTAADLAARIEAGGGKATLTTAGGQDLILSMSGNKILLTAAGGNRAVVTAADLGRKNGVIHVVDAVLMPRM